MRTYDSKDLTDPIRETADRIARRMYKLSNDTDAYFKRHGLDRVFLHPLWVTDEAPPVHVSESNELGRFYRMSSSLVVKVPFGGGRAIALGIWNKPIRDEAEGLLAAVRPTSAPDSDELEALDESNPDIAGHSDASLSRIRSRAQGSGEEQPDPGPGAGDAPDAGPHGYRVIA
jgi:hypothetical protein